MVKNYDVVKEFMNYGVNEKIKTKHLFFIKDVLFSYGSHFPLCIRLKNGFFINKNSYSNTTSHHKGLICRTFGFNNFKILQEELKKEKTKNILLFDTEELKNIISQNESFKFLTMEDILKLRVLNGLK